MFLNALTVEYCIFFNSKYNEPPQYINKFFNKVFIYT